MLSYAVHLHELWKPQNVDLIRSYYGKHCSFTPQSLIPVHIALRSRLIDTRYLDCNMALAVQLQQQYNDFLNNAPAAVQNPIVSAKDNFNANFDTSRVIKPGETLPVFTLPDATGKIVSSSDLLAKQPLLITFYRGEWCPFCNITLAALQKRHPEYLARGVQFVAISPELPNMSLSMTEKHDLEFPVLSDAGLKYARQLGIVFKQDESVREPFEIIGINLNERNGDNSFELPVPVTLLVGQDSIVRNVYLDPDFTKRLEPEVALSWIEDLKREH